jgi:germination protein M
VRVLVGVATLLLALPLLGGCGGDDDSGAPALQPPAPPTSHVRVYLLRDGKLWPTARQLRKEEAQANGALRELFQGPTFDEYRLDFETAVSPFDVGTFSLVGVPGGERGAVSLELERSLPRTARAQIVATLTQFPLVAAVILGERTYRRSDFEDLMPAILVESPLPNEQVSSPLHVFGTSNTFEATFSYELLDAEGDVLDDDFVTATSGTGMRGRFEFVAPYEVDEEVDGTLVVFELSAKDGSRINVAEVPLRLTP